MNRLSKCPSSKYTDKGSLSHTFRGLSYLDIYDKYFSPLKLEKLNILEIGISAYHNPDDLRGSSLWIWSEYFPNARIFGLDIDPICKQYERERVKIHIGDQQCKNVLLKLAAAVGRFDIIIDDGSHVNEYTLKSFETLFPFLNPDGMYIIEDLGTSYAKIEEWGAREDWPGMRYNDPHKSLNNERSTMDNLFKKLLSDLDHKQKEIISIQFWSEMCFIIKGSIYD